MKANDDRKDIITFRNDDLDLVHELHIWWDSHVKLYDSDGEIMAEADIIDGHPREKQKLDAVRWAVRYIEDENTCIVDKIDTSDLFKDALDKIKNPILPQPFRPNYEPNYYPTEWGLGKWEIGFGTGDTVQVPNDPQKLYGHKLYGTTNIRIAGDDENLAILDILNKAYTKEEDL